MQIIRLQRLNIIPTSFISANLRIGLAFLLLLGAAAISRGEGASTLTASDGLNSSSFNAAQNWSGKMAPGPGTNFFTAAFTIRTPSTAGNYTFQGDSLTINTGGGMSLKNGTGNSVTINNLTNSGSINEANNPSTTGVIAGNMTVVGAASFNTSGSAAGDVRTITNNMTMSGTGTVTNTDLAGVFPGTVVYNGNNTAFTGPMLVISNQTVQAASQSNLGGNPASFNAAQFVLNNGTLLPTASFAMNNANSGVTLGASGGTFNIATNLTLTIANPIAGPGSLTKTNTGTLVLSGANTYTNGTVISAGIINAQNNQAFGTNGAVNQASGARNAMIQLQGGVTIPAAVTFTLSNDGNGTSQSPITTNAIESLSGNNTINGTITLTTGGGNAAIQSDSGALVINGNVRIASGQSSRGVNLQGASTAANSMNGPIADLSSTSVNSVTKNGPGNWTLTATNTYSGLTIINGGTLFLSGSGSISNTPLISIASGATFDVSGLASIFVLNANQSLSNSVGTVNGSLATASGSTIYPATAGVTGTLTFNNNLNLSSGGTIYFDLSTSAASGNDQIVVGGNLTLSSSDYIHINALSGSLDTSDYVLFSVGTGTTVASTPVLVWDGSVPGNDLNYSLLQVGNNLVLHYSASTAPSVTASANPTSGFRNQAVLVTANVTQGSGSIVSVTVDLTPVGGSATTGLILDSADSTPPTYIYTNTFLVSASTALGNKSLTVVATDNSSPTPLTGTFIITPFAITAETVTWDGGGADNKWTSNPNWVSDLGPGYSGDSVAFDTMNQLMTDMNTNYLVTGLTFNSGAGAFAIGSSTGSTLTLTNIGGIVNNSPSTETLNVPVALISAQTFIAVSGNLTLNTNISLGGNTLTVDGAANTSIAGVVSGTAGIAKNGSGTLLLSAVNTYGNNGAADTSVNVGVLAIGNNLALGSSRLNIGDGGTIQSSDNSAHIITNNLNFGSGAGGNVIFGGTGNLKLTGSANNGTAKTLTVNNPQTELSGVMSGASARTVSGTGTLILSGANAYTGGTTINSGATLQLGNGGATGTLSTSGAIDDEGTLTINRSNTVVQGVDFSSSPITGGGSFVQAGSGTTTLNAANTYSGLTAVNSGALLITPAYQNGGNVSVADGAIFGVAASFLSNSATIGNLTLGNVGATTLDFAYSQVGNPTNAALTASAVTINGACTIHVGGSLVAGTFPVLSYSSLSGAFAGAVVGPRNVPATLFNDTVHQIVYVTVSSVGNAIVWTGTNSFAPDLWDLNATTNWLIIGLPTAYLETVPPGDMVAFNDQGSGLVLLSNTVSPTSVTFSNTAVNYTVQGSGQINSEGGLTKVGTGTVTLNLAGTYSGSTVVSNGVINLGASQTFANLSGNGAVTASAGTPTLTVNDNLNTSFAGNFSGALTLAETGGGQLTLSGSNNFSGNFYVDTGTVALYSGSISAGNYCSIGHVGTDSGTLTLGGAASFTTTSDFNAGDVGSAAGILNIQDSASLTANAVYIGSANATGSTASGTVYQTGGTVSQLSTTAGTFCIGGRTSASGVGVYNLSGGTLTSAAGIRVGSTGQGTLNQSGGTVVATGGVNIAQTSGSSGTYELDGGALLTASVTSSTAANAILNLNGGVLIPLGNSTTFVTNLSQVNIRNGGLVVDTTNFAVTIAQTLQHSTIGGDNATDGGLTKRGNGTLTLTAAGSSYTGPTVVTAGGLTVSPGSVSSLNSLTVNNAALNLAVTGGSASVAAGSVTLANNVTLNLNYTLLSGTPVAALNASGSLAVSGTTTINVFGYGWTTGQYPLVAYTGTPLANLNSFVLGALPYGVTATLSNNTANLSLDLVVSAVSLTTWIPLTTTDPAGSSSFAAGNSWLGGGAPVTGNGYLTEVFALRSPANANAYTFAGSALSVDTGGRFIMKGINGQVMTVSNLIINGGLVDYANGADNFTETLGGNIILQAGLTNYLGALGSATLSETLYVTAPISGGGNLQISGSPVANTGTDVGVVVLAATNTYTGPTAVATGTLLVNGATGNSPISVGSGATLGGTGIIGGTVNVQAGGKLAPGIPAQGALTNTIATLTASTAASVSGAVVMKINPAASPASDEFAAPGITVNAGATLTVTNIGTTNLVAGDTFALFSTPISGAFSAVTLPTLAGTNLFWTNTLALNGSIAVAAVVTVNTNSTNITASVLGNTLALSWPADHLGWHLQVQTNSLSSGLGTNWFTIPGSDAVDSTNIPINPANSSVFYRLIYP